MHKYPIDSKVYHGGCPAKVREHIGINAHGIPEYYLTYEDPKLGDMYCTERQLTDDEMFTAWCNSVTVKKCTCGIDSTGIGGLHSSWCEKEGSSD